MRSSVFHFKQFSVRQDNCPMKVGTDGVLLGAWADLPTEISKEKKILDIGTGTGVIALMLAQKLFTVENEKINDFVIDAIDIDEASCKQARENIDASKFKSKINVINKPLHQFSESVEPGCYKIIISNPPYFKNSLKSPNNLRNSSRHSDFAELSSDKLISAVIKLLSKEGAFYLILPKTEGENFIEQAKKSNLYCNKITRVFSKPGKECIRMLLQFEHCQKHFSENTLTIETGRSLNDFTEEYKLLTREFYFIKK